MLDDGQKQERVVDVVQGGGDVDGSLADEVVEHCAALVT
jgi:hypothetical protein